MSTGWVLPSCQGHAQWMQSISPACVLCYFSFPFLFQRHVCTDKQWCLICSPDERAWLLMFGRSSIALVGIFSSTNQPLEIATLANGLDVFTHALSLPIVDANVLSNVQTNFLDICRGTYSVNPFEGCIDHCGVRLCNECPEVSSTRTHSHHLCLFTTGLHL